MSITTLIGFLSGLLIFTVAILSSTQDANIFINLPGIAIVLGGTVASTFVSFPFRDVSRVFKALWIIFKRDEPVLAKYITDFCTWAGDVKSRGLSTLDEVYENMPNSFLKDCLELMINGHTKEEIQSNLESSLNTMVSRYQADANIFKMMGAAAPAFGMMGTLIGLIVMLQTMGPDPSSLGPALAIALTTTFYGVLLANLIFFPISEKILRRMESEIHFRAMLIEGTTLLMEKRHPLFIQDKLNSFLAPKNRLRNNDGSKSE